FALIATSKTLTRFSVSHDLGSLTIRHPNRCRTPPYHAVATVPCRPFALRSLRDPERENCLRWSGPATRGVSTRLQQRASHFCPCPNRRLCKRCDLLCPLGAGCERSECCRRMRDGTAFHRPSTLACRRGRHRSRGLSCNRILDRRRD